VREALVSGDMLALPPELAHAAEEAQSILSRTSNPQLADFSLDRAYFEALTKLASAVTDPYAMQYVKLLIDNANLRAVVRTIRMGKDEDFLRLALVPGGEVSEPTLLAAAESPESFASAFQASRLAEAAEIGADAMQGGALTKFERQCDNTVLRFVKDAKRRSFCASHVVAYLAAMENEVTALRMILTGRLAGLSSDTIRERLRETYA
jgi:V/A-type H+-transporting ATPase subunit C